MLLEPYEWTCPFKIQIDFHMINHSDWCTGRVFLRFLTVQVAQKQACSWKNTISSPDLNIGTTFAIFSSLENMPVTWERLHICASGLFIQFWVNFIMRGRKSSHPASLSLTLHVILYISSSVTADTKNFSDISNMMYSLGYLLVEGISLTKDSPTFKKKY